MPSLAPPAPQNYIETLRSRIIEGRTLTPYEYRPVAIPLQTTLNAALAQGSASFTIPSNQRLILRQFIPHVVPSVVSAAGNAPSGSTTNAAILPATNNANTLYARALNCRLNLALASRTFDLFVQNAFTLADLMSFNGGDPSLADMPGILPQGTNIDLNISLVDTAGTAATACEYGIVLVGAYVQV